MLDPQTSKFTLIDTCFPTHHVQFGFDADRTLWTSSGGIGAEVLGWLNTKMLEETGDEAKSQGWTPFILDTNGNGKRDEGYIEPNQPVDPTKDKRIRVGFYAVAPSPVDGTIWGSVIGYPGLGGPGRSRRESAGDRAGGNLRGAAARLLAARHRHRQQGRHVGGARERPSRRASTAASAKARSTARPRPASSAPKAGRSIRCRDRSSAA